MRVRLIFYCPRCGSLLFRPSLTRKLRDTLLTTLGIHAHRCYMCRLRFYLFKPARLKEFLLALDRPMARIRGGQPDAVEAAEETGKRRPSVVWDLIRQNRLW